MTENFFDPIKAISEEIIGLCEVQISLRRQITRVETRLSEAESEHNGLLKIEGFITAEIARKSAVKRQLDEKNNARR